MPTTDSKDAARLMLAGALWLALGTGLIIAGYLLRAPSPEALARYGPLLPMLAGAYGVVVGLEKMVTGFSRGRRCADAAERRRVGTATGACVVVCALAASGGWAAYAYRAPYWRAVSDLAAGDAATAQLRALAERHAARMQEGAGDAEAIDLWRRTAAEALALRPRFTSALDAARHLAADGSGDMRRHAETDVRFYGLCLEWMDLYARVQQRLGEESMAAPPDEWGRTLNDIIERIEALHEHPHEGA